LLDQDLDWEIDSAAVSGDQDGRTGIWAAEWLMTFVSVTRLRIRSLIFLPGFIIHALRSSRQARQAEGNLGVKLLRDRQNTFWTCTAWSSEASMRAFMLAKPHGPTMRKLIHWCDEAAVVHWTQPEAALPSWQDACKRMVKEGRASKVNHPSPDHAALTFPPPKVSGKDR
jgi:heme-degrading monooxygenase HmoA